MAERLNAPVLKTDVGQLTGGSNPSPSAISILWPDFPVKRPGEVAPKTPDALMQRWSKPDPRSPFHTAFCEASPGRGEEI